MSQWLRVTSLTNLARPIGRVTPEDDTVGRLRARTRVPRVGVNLPRQIYRMENKWIPGIVVQ